MWVRHFVAASTTGQTNGSDLLSQFESDYGAGLIGCTIVRIRGIMWASAAAGVGTTNAFRFGARVASGAGLDLSQPLPTAADMTNDENADWMLWEPMAHVVSTAGGAPIDQLTGRVVDVKSSRKLEELNERLIMVAGPNSGAPTIEWSYGWDLSIGVKLP